MFRSVLCVLLFFCLSEGKENCLSGISNEDLMKLYDDSSYRLGPSGQACKDNWINQSDIVTSCHNVYQFCNSVIELVSISSSTNDIAAYGNESNGTTPVTQAEAFLYGTLMVLTISLLSLLGLIIVPLVKSKSVIGQIIYKHTLTLLVAMGTSALLCSSLFELIPVVLHVDDGHGHHLNHKIRYYHDDHDDHDHDDEESNDYIWKTCAIIGGVFLFYIFELVLYHLVETINNRKQSTVDHSHKSNVGHDKTPLMENEDGSAVRVPTYDETCCQRFFTFKRVKPLAWIILAGDLLHNVADGVTIGAAISQSLTLGLSTTFAIALHELPHELADFAILVKSGMHWFTALLFNFLSSFGAIIGFFVGVAVSTSSTESKEWLLALAAGSFLYISLADLLPELRNSSHSHDDGHDQSSEASHTSTSLMDRVIQSIVIIFGFFISFIFLLLITLNEAKLNSLF